MWRLFYILSFLLFLAVVTGCARDSNQYSLNKNRFVAILTIDEKMSDRPGYEAKEMQRVINWMDRDLISRLRKQNFETSYLKSLKEYSKSMGDLFIVNIESFNGGRYNKPRHIPTTGRSFLELQYKLLDAKGELVTEWRDGTDSRRGGTYCAKLLNKKAVQRLNKLYR